MKKILVVGSSNIDIVVGTKSLPAPGETVHGLSVDKKPGGKGANQAVAAGKLGGDVTFLSAIGNEDDSSILLNMFELSGLHVDHLLRTTTQTGTAYILVDENGRNSIVAVPGANNECTTEYLESCKEVFDEADIILLSLEIPQESVEYSIRLGAEKGKSIILNPAPAPESFNESLYSCIDYITPNETELGKMSGMTVSSDEEIVKAATTLLEKGVRNVLVTLGGRGAMLVNSSGHKVFTPPDITVVDTTAAGDTFNGAVCVYLAEGRSIEDAITFANNASTISVSRKGAQTSIPFRKEVEEFMERGGVL